MALMDEVTLATVRRYEERLQKVLAEAAKIKHHINGLYELEGEVGPYPEEELNGLAPITRQPHIRPDQFFGRPLATVVKEVLAPREGKEGAIPLDELYATLLKGGFQFEGKDESTKKRILASTIGRNPAFVRVPSGAIGLAEWYQTVKRGRPKGSSNTDHVSDEQASVAPSIGATSAGENLPPPTGETGSHE